MHAHLDGADAAVEQARELLVVDVVEPVQGEQLALLERQRAERAAHEGEVVGLRGLFGGVRRVVGHLVQVVGLVETDGGVGVFAEVVGGDLAGEMVDPGGELALVAVGVPVFQDAVEKRAARDPRWRCAGR